MRASLILVASLLAGCASRGLRMPGPTRAMGAPPPRYADTLEAEPTPAAESPPARAQAAAAPPPELGEKPADAAPRRRRRGNRQGERVAQEAGRLVGKSRLVVDGERYRYDCSGMVAAAHAAAGTDISGSSRNLFDAARDNGLLHRRKVPSPGDIAFFDDTYDRNRNGRRDDDLTHVAVVESVEADGTMVLVHKGSKGVTRITMNLKRPHDHRDASGRALNSHLRASNGRDGGPTLSAELWRAFGSLWALPADGVADAG